MNKLFLLCTAGLIGLTGCSKSSAVGLDRDKPKGASSANELSARHPTAPNAQNPRDIAALFQVEASNRPTGTLRAEDVLEAFRRSGIELHEERQHLARPYGARYCRGAKSGAGLALSVCEYIDASAAQSGAEVSRKIPLAHREIRLNRATSLTVRHIDKTPASDALAQRLFETFAKL